MLPSLTDQSLLLTPGPVPLHPKVIEALAQPMIHHRTQAFTRYLMDSRQGLKHVFQTQQDVFILSSTGSGGMEALIANTIAPGDRVLVIQSGKFGERWANIAKRYPMAETIVYPVTPGKNIKLAELEEKIQQVRPHILLTQATETSTGQKHPIHSISTLYHRLCPDGLLLVDGITAVGAYSLPMDEWDIDGLVAGSQKAFMVPTGLSFVSLSERAWQKKQKLSSCSYYWDLSLEQNANQKQQTYFSSNITLIRALQVALELILEKGLQAHFAEIAARSSLCREFFRQLGYQSFCDAPSESVTAILIPWGSSVLRDHLETQYQLTLMDGQDEWKNRLLRIGHMGYIPPEHLIESLRRIYLGMKDLQAESLKQNEPHVSSWLQKQLKALTKGGATF